MSSDGASEGIGIARALETVLGGAPPPDPDEGRSREDMRAWLLSCPGPPEVNTDGRYAEANLAGYEQAAREAAKRVLQAYDADPTLTLLPMDTEYAYTDPKTFSGRYKVQDGLYEVLAERGVSFDDLGLSGFMWGWAVNAARYCMDVSDQPNPAILTIDIGTPRDQETP